MARPEYLAVIQMNFAVAHIRTRLSPCEVCGGQSGTGHRSSSKSFRFSPVSIVQPLTHCRLRRTRRTAVRRPETSIRSVSVRSGVLKRRCRNYKSCVMLRHEDRSRFVDVSGDSSAFFRVKQSNRLGQVILACLAPKMQTLRCFETSGTVYAAM